MKARCDRGTDTKQRARIWRTDRTSQCKGCKPISVRTSCSLLKMEKEQQQQQQQQQQHQQQQNKLKS
jgi:hypothetical protein